jgi:hypothetical protein
VKNVLLGLSLIALAYVNAEGATLATNHRGEPRDSMFDVGAFEVQL